MLSIVSQMKDGFPFRFFVRLMLNTTSADVILFPLANVTLTFSFTVNVRPSSENS